MGAREDAEELAHACLHDGNPVPLLRRLTKRLYHEVGRETHRGGHTDRRPPSGMYSAHG